MSRPLCLDCAALAGDDWRDRTAFEDCSAADCPNATVTIVVGDADGRIWDLTLTYNGSGLSATDHETAESASDFHLGMLADFAADNLYEEIEAAWAAREG